MREIKFRAWSGDTMWYFRPLEPSYQAYPAGPTLECYQVGKQIDGRLDEQTILMQFTGLHDKNGKEIYEGDIVKILYTDWPSCGGCHGSPKEHMEAIAQTKVVIWSVQGFYLSHEVDGYAEGMEPGAHGFIQVIGNLYENPELLKT